MKKFLMMKYSAIQAHETMKEHLQVDVELRFYI